VKLIKSAFFQIMYHDEEKEEDIPIVIVLDPVMKDGTTSTCIELNPDDGYYYHCNLAKEGDEFPPPTPTLTNEKVGVNGFIITCDATLSDSDCDQRMPKEILRKYEPLAKTCTAPSGLNFADKLTFDELRTHLYLY